MAQKKSSAKGWIIGVLIVILIAVGAYVFIKNRASADVVAGSAYKFEILSNRKLTIQSSGSNTIGGASYRIVEPIELKSGFGLRLRKNTGAIVSGIKIAGSNQEGIFFQDSTNTLAGVYPNIAGKHKITVTVPVRSTTGQVKPQMVALYFEALASASPTPIPSANPSTIPSPRPSVSPIAGKPMMGVLYEGQRYYNLNTNSTPLEIKKGKTFTVFATHSYANNLVLSTFCTNTNTCDQSNYLQTSSPVTTGDTQEVTITANYTGEYSIWSRVPSTTTSESFRVNITE
jgi:hypothetical protein